MPTPHVYRRLALNDLQTQILAITPEVGATFVQACAVCFDKNGHADGVKLTVKGVFNAQFIVHWDCPISEAILRCWGQDMGFTVEQAAYGIAILLIQNLTDFTAIRRSWKGTGFDYWLGHKDALADLPFQDAARLEVSGILRGEDREIKQRVRLKTAQIQRSGNSLPGFVIVVEFGRPLSQVEKK